MIKQTFKVIIAGTRTFDDYNFLCERMDILLENQRKQGKKIVVICGMARGADLLGKMYAEQRKYTVYEFPADWSMGKLAGPKRNQQMAEVSDALVAFWDGRSRGTENMIKQMQVRNKMVRIMKIK